MMVLGQAVRSNSAKNIVNVVFENKDDEQLYSQPKRHQIAVIRPYANVLAAVLFTWQKSGTGARRLRASQPVRIK